MDFIFRVFFAASTLGSVFCLIIHTNYTRLNVPEDIPKGYKLFEIEASSEINDNVTIKTYDEVTASRVELVPVTVGTFSRSEVRTKEYPFREMDPFWYLSFQVLDKSEYVVWRLPVYFDEINYVPYFDKEIYLTRIPFNIKAGTKVLQVKAQDNNTGPYGDLTYLMTPINNKEEYIYKAFELNPDTGDITVVIPLEESIVKYEYIVTAVDNGVPPLSQAAFVTILVEPL